MGSSVASGFRDTLLSHGYVTEQIPTDIFRTLQRDTTPTAIVISVVDTGKYGLNALVSARKAVPRIPVLVLVGSDQAKVAVEALKLGATEVYVMPVNPGDLLSFLRKVQENHRAGATALEYSLQSVPDTAVFLSRNPNMLELWNVAARVARSDVPVLILGESGVGKEVLARFIQRHSRRADKPLIKVNCAALPGDLLESELFGYERGAFTGAVGEKPGKFELADGGCILLDEIAEMAPNLQAKLLHVLEDGEFSRLGAKLPTKVDVRVLGLTNRKLHEAIALGEFRGDLYFRLSVVEIDIPPLRERKEDIPMLAAHLLKRHREALASSIQELPPALLEAFMKYAWPGNVRQLENTIRRYLILPELDMELSATAMAAGSPTLSAGKITAAAEMAGTTSSVVRFPGPNETVSLRKVSASAAERAERELVLHVLEQTNWNRSLAARRLNICYRALLNKLNKWQINRPRASAVRRAG
jgi:two-component system, NtrC family, response regulator AtoC